MGVAFLFLLCAFLPSLTTVEWIDIQHFAKTKIEYISLPSNLNAIIGITSYYCVILKMVILHVAIKTIHNGVLCFFIKRTKTCFFSKIKTKKFGLKKQKNRWVVFFKTGFSQPWLFSTYLWFSLDRTIWNKSRQYQFVGVCAGHLEYKSLVLKNVRIAGIWMDKN